MTQFVYPNTIELRLIEQEKLPNLQAQREIFNILHLRTSDDAVLAWEQEDNYTGLQQLRGANGAPTRVVRTGAKQYLAQPGVYGEFTAIEETELMQRRAWGTLDQTINISDLVMREQDRLLARRLDRIEYIGWQLLVNGQFSISTPNGTVAHTDAYTTQTFTSTTAWSVANTSTPLADFRAVKILARGHSVRFDSSARAYANQSTINKLLSNNNATDLYGRRAAGLQTINSPAQLSALLLEDGLPQLTEYEGGYYDSTGTWQLYIPDNKVVVIGVRTSGTAIAEYVMTRNVNNPGMEPGSYTRVIDRGESQIPRSVEVHDGHNGGPTMLFPSAIVVMNV